jgi:hypothetical protein
MKTNIKITMLAVLYLASSPFLRAQTSSATPNAVLQDNRFITVDIAATDPHTTNRDFIVSDYELDSIIHYNTRLSQTDTASTSTQAPTPYPTATATPAPTATPTATPTPTPTPTPVPTATPTPTATPKPAKTPQSARNKAKNGNK